MSVRTFDDDGKITQIDSACLKTYSYDDAFGITGITNASDSSLSWTYGYDDAGNTTSYDGITFTYNNRGRIKRRRRAASRRATRTMRWGGSSRKEQRRFIFTMRPSECSASMPTPSTGEVDVSVRCGRLPAVMGGSSGGVHCEVVAVCKKTGESVAFGIGGGGNGIWERLFGGKTPPKYQNPAPSVPPGDVSQYTATCGKGGNECDGCQALECFKKMQSGNTPPPYYALWQNSNEYAHSLLNQCGCSISSGMRGPPGAVAW